MILWGETLTSGMGRRGGNNNEHCREERVSGKNYKDFIVKYL